VRVVSEEQALSARRKWWRRGLALTFALLFILVGIALLVGWTAFGKRATGARLERMRQSPAFRGGRFHNPQPLVNDWLRSLGAMFDGRRGASPEAPIPTEKPNFSPTSDLRVTWFGHSSVLVEIDGWRVLTDPMWGERVGPLPWIGPRRWFAPPLPLAELPPLDAVVISHDHYDHLDYPTVLALRDRGARFFVPLGVGAHLAYWGVPEGRIVELDWWQSAKVGELEITCTPSRHASGRTLVDDDSKLWSGWALKGPRHRVYYSGDTGLFPGMAEIGARLGPFDLTMIEIGQYHAAWPDWHIGPEQAVEAHQLVGGRVMLPVHWALFELAPHTWTEPIERVAIAAETRRVQLITPRPGQSVEPASARFERWWPKLPFQTAAEAPIVSTQRN
jgi:L-ascorbate metabolism protein UlaG (beta-lactamase superfamily)